MSSVLTKTRDGEREIFNWVKFNYLCFHVSVAIFMVDVSGGKGAELNQVCPNSL